MYNCEQLTKCLNASCFIENGIKVVSVNENNEAEEIVFYGDLAEGVNCKTDLSSALKKVTFIDATVIKEGMFEGCSNLEEVIFSDSLKAIEGYAFKGCTSLKNITIPEKVSFIGDYAFSESGIKSIEIKASVPPVLGGAEAIPYSSGIFQSVFVPASDDDSVLNSYKSATNWCNLNIATKIYEQEEIVRVVD